MRAPRTLSTQNDVMLRDVGFLQPGAYFLPVFIDF